jgi:hypothetical protein
MALLILSKETQYLEETLSSVFIAAFRAGLKVNLGQSKDSTDNNNVELYIAKKYQNVDEEEYFYLGIESESEAIRKYDLLNLVAKGNKYYRLAISDQANHDHLMYDFALEYLRLNPDHSISLYGDSYFFLEDLEKIESKGGYYKDWCFK